MFVSKTEFKPLRDDTSQPGGGWWPMVENSDSVAATEWNASVRTSTTEMEQ